MLYSIRLVVMATYDKTIPTDLAMKVSVSALAFILPMMIAMKYLSPLIYGVAATKAIIYQTIVIIVLPGMMIGMGMLALRAQSMSWGKLLFRTILMSLFISCLAAAAGIPIFLHP